MSRGFPVHICPYCRSSTRQRSAESIAENPFCSGCLQERLDSFVAEQKALIQSKLPNRPACLTCHDTHHMVIGEEDSEREVMCTYCPSPCMACGFGGPFCATSPCKCSCHAAGYHKDFEPSFIADLPGPLELAIAEAEQTLAHVSSVLLKLREVQAVRKVATPGPEIDNLVQSRLKIAREHAFKMRAHAARAVSVICDLWRVGEEKTT